MGRTYATLVAGLGLLFACASPDDDSWQGAADDELGEGAAGAGGSSSTKTVTSGATTTASVTTGVSSSATVGGSTSTVTTGGGCDSGSCDSCQQCAMNGACAASIDACLNDTACYALLECLNACVDEACFNECANTHSAGIPLYNAVGDCVFCDVCVSTCGAC